MKKFEIETKLANTILNQFVEDVNCEEYKTIGGNLVILVTKKGGGECPWLGFYYTADTVGGEWIPCAWTEGGKILSMSKSGKSYFPLDLDILEDQPQVA